MRYFLDTEFIEDGKTIDLISIGLVAEDGREYYACNDECKLSNASDWVKENVLPHLPPKFANAPDHSSPNAIRDSLAWKSRQRIKADILDFIGSSKPEFWAYYADYDWVVFCQLFGTMMDLPEGFPMYCRDIKQWCDQLGNPQLPEQGTSEHNALADARWNKQAWGYLNSLQG